MTPFPTFQGPSVEVPKYIVIVLVSATQFDSELSQKQRPHWALTEEATLSCTLGFYVFPKYPYQIYAKHKTRTNDIALNKSAMGPNP